MKENRLISMVEFVDRQAENWEDEHECFYFCVDYAKFLNQPLNIGQFVPAVFDGGKWVVLEEVVECKSNDKDCPCNHIDMCETMQQFQQAKDKVIFEGFCIYNPKRNSHRFSARNIFNGVIVNFSLNQAPKYPHQTIQDLIEYKQTLTKYGIEQSGLNK